ncbi:MAG: hypothetical protein R3C52_07270 [Hyphomonadaceae bacterium]
MATGLFTEGDSVHVLYGRHAFPVPAEYYEDRGYEPPRRDLPTREQYEAAAGGDG